MNTSASKIMAFASALFLLFGGVLPLGLTSVYATPPASPYDPGETLEPNCEPGDTNCTVVAPAAAGNNNDITSLLQSITFGDEVTFEDNISFDTTAITIAGIANGDLLSRIAVETISALWTFAGGINVDGVFSMAEIVAPAVSSVGEGRIYFDATDNTFKVSENGGAYVDLLSSTGETNTASNVGTAGVGVFDGKDGVDLEFRNINAGSNRISITDDTVNDEIDIDVNQANLSITESQISDLGSYLESSDIDTSAELRGIVGDETGTGSAVFGTSPTIATPSLTLENGTGDAPTTDGQIKYDRTTERLQVGDGTTTQEFYPGPHTVDTNTNANTECSGTNTYLDGEGNCDDISSTYQASDEFLDDIAALTDPDDDRIFFFDDSADTVTWLDLGTNLTITGTTLNAASTGETNTASNVGTAGVGVFDGKDGVDLEFRNINAGSNRISITDDTVNDEIDIDVNQANLSITESQISDLGSYLESSDIDTSSELRGIVGDETGTGSAVFGTSPTVSTPVLTLRDGVVNSTVDGEIRFDRTAELLEVGDGSGTLQFHPGPHTTDTNANTECSGTDTYLDGEGNCDDISSTYQASDEFLDDIAALTDPDDDRIFFFDDSADTVTWLDLGTNLTITGTTLNAATSSADFSDGGEAGTADRTLGNTDNFDLGFITNNVTRLHIQNNGSIGVGGNTSPGEALDATGNINVSGDYRIGGSTMLHNPGTQNAFMGILSGDSVTDADDSVFVGYASGENTTDGDDNTFVGYNTGNANTSGGSNVFIGYAAGSANTLADDNVYIGSNAGVNSTTGIRNVYIGSDSGGGNANETVAIGYRAGNSNIAGENVFIGHLSGDANVGGAANTFMGDASGFSNTEGSLNTFVGRDAGRSNTTGQRNVAIGEGAGESNNGQANVFIGPDAGGTQTNSSNELYIDNTDTSDPLIFGDFNNDELVFNGQVDIFANEGDAQALYTAFDGSVPGLNMAVFDRTTPTPEDDDFYDFVFRHENDNDEQVDIAQMSIIASDISDGTEGGALAFSTADGVDGSLDEAMRIIAGGNIGIGTTAPNTILDVNGAMSMREISAPSVSPSDQGRIYFDNTDNKFKVSENGGAYVDLIGGGGGGGDFANVGEAGTADRTLGNTDNFDLGLLTNNLTRLHIQNDGNIGVGGNTTPGEALDATGNVNVSGDYRIGGSTVLETSAILQNTFVGIGAGVNNVGGNDNTFVGYGAGENNTGGTDNTFVGYNAGNASSSTRNVFMGYATGDANTSGANNVYIGYNAADTSTSGEQNVVIGSDAGGGNTSYSVIIGHNAGNVSNGSQNVFVGHEAGQENTSGVANIFIGDEAGNSNLSGNLNTFVGYNSGRRSTSGTSNVYVGERAGEDNNGSNNVFIGPDAGANETNTSNSLFIDNSNTSLPLVHGNFSSDIFTVNGQLDVVAKTSDPQALYASINNVSQGGDLAVFDRITNFAADGNYYDIVFRHGNDADQQEDFAVMRMTATDVSDGTEGGSLSFLVANGTLSGADPVEVMTLNSDTTTTFQSSIIFDNPAPTEGILTNTVDGSDDDTLIMSSAGGIGPTRGAFIQLAGNEASAGNEGVLYLAAGDDSAGGEIRFETGSTERMRIEQNGNVGIGTSDPQSALHVPDNSYAQFEDNNAGAPPAGDCDADTERGRMSIDITNNRLYICNGATRGWDYILMID